MKNLERAVIAAVVVSAVLMSPVNASFEPLGVGPRAIGLSNAYTAIGDDVYSIYYNPAGISRLQRAEFASYFGTMYRGLTDNSNLSQVFVGFGQPMGSLGDIAFSYYSFELSSWYRESMITLAYSKSMSLGFMSGISGGFDGLSTRTMNIGVSLKNLTKEHSDPDGWTTDAVESDGLRRGSSDPVFSNGGYSKNGITADLGIQFTPASGYTVGIAILNLMEPDLGLQHADPVTREIKIGVSRAVNSVTMVADLSSKQFVEADNRLAIGAEKYFFSGIGVRGGMAIGLNREFNQVTFGFSYKAEGLQFDYGLLLPLHGIGDAFGNHRIGLTFKFGKIYQKGEDIYW